VQNEEVLLEDLETEDLSDLEIGIIDEEIDLEPVEETVGDDILVLEDLDTEELIEQEIEIIDEDSKLESIEEVLPVEEEIVLDDLDTEELTSDLSKSADLSKDIDFDIDDIEEINGADLEIESLEDESLPVVASEPDATSTIDMELPEMHDEGLTELSPQLKTEIKSVLSYMDQLLESLPEEKIDEFANSEHYEVYKKLFEELGLN